MKRIFDVMSFVLNTLYKTQYRWLDEINVSDPAQNIIVMQSIAYSKRIFITPEYEGDVAT